MLLVSVDKYSSKKVIVSSGLSACMSQQKNELKENNKVLVRPEFFYFLVLGKFLGKPSVGGGNKNKNKIQKFPESE